MRRFLTSGVKAILAIAALSTAAHWALRVQRDPAPGPQLLAGLPDPATTGSIAPRQAEPRAAVAQPMPKPSANLDQDHLSALIASTTGMKPKVQKAVVAKR